MDNTPHARVCGMFDKSVAARHNEALPGVALGRLYALENRLDQGSSLFLKHRLKQGRFVAVVVVQRASGYPGASHNLFCRGLRIALLSKHIPGNADQGSPGPLRLLVF